MLKNGQSTRVDTIAASCSRLRLENLISLPKRFMVFLSPSSG